MLERMEKQNRIFSGFDADAIDRTTAADLAEVGSDKWTRYPGCIGAFIAEMDYGLAPCIQQAIDSQQIRHYKGRNPLTGERILAVSSPMIYTNGEVIGVLRYVTSLRNADLQILMIALIAITIGLLFIGSIFFLSSFFIKSILVPVSQINATARRIAAGSYGVQIIDEVKPDPADFVVYKNRFNGFVNTTLEKKLRQMQINTVIMTGWRSDVCVAQTAIEAFYRGFRVAVADDGVNSTTEAEHRQGMQLLAINYNFDFYPCETILENLLQQE